MRRLCLGLSALLLLALFVPVNAGAQVLFRGFNDDAFVAGSPEAINFWFDATVAANANMVRLNLSWDQAVGGKPENPTNPADPAYDFSESDAAISRAVARGLPVLLTVYRAPAWAEGPNRPPSILAGAWKPDPTEFGDFAEAVGRRYSGNFGDLPRVRYFEVWNEPNLSDYLAPQYAGARMVGAELYRKLVNEFYTGVKKFNPQSQVVAGGTAPYGNDPPNAYRARPLFFLRSLLCLQGSLSQLRPKSCRAKAKFDILSHHPITLGRSPSYSAISPYDATVADFHNVRKLLRTAEQRRTLGTPGRHPLWATEIWWETNPPDRTQFGIPVQRHARWLEEALYSLHTQGASAVFWLQIVDTETNNRSGGYQTGLFTFGGKRKPAFTAFRFPFVADRRNATGVRVWSIPPSSGQLQIQRKVGKRWRAISRAKVKEDRIFQRTLRIRGPVTLRGVIAGEESLGWTEGGPSRPSKRARQADPNVYPAAPSTASPRLAPYVETP